MGDKKTSKSKRNQGWEWKVAAWGLRHPGFVLAPSTVGASVVEFGAGWTGGVAGGLLAGLAAWYRGHPDTFDSWVTPRLREFRRRWLSKTYLGPNWFRLTEACNLVTVNRSNDTINHPRITKIRSHSPSTETVYIRLLYGQNIRAWQDAAETLAPALNAERVGVEQAGNQTIALIVQRWEPFDRVIVPPDVVTDADLVDLSNVYLGETEYGTDWTAPLIGQHWLISGVTGSGKGSPIWMALRACAPLIRDGLVRLHIANPKATEMRAARPVSYRYAEDDKAISTMISGYWDTLEQRKKHLAEKGLRTFHMSRETPLDILLIDELGAVTGYGASNLRREVTPKLALILSQARALGGTVIGALQEPTKDVIPQRDLFTFRVQMRAATSAQPDMVLGEDMRKRGAMADEIPNIPETAGIGYAVRERTRTPIRVRCAYPNDNDNAEAIRIAGWPHTELDTTTGTAILPTGARKDNDDDDFD